MEKISINELAELKFKELMDEMFPEGYAEETYNAMKLMYISGMHDGMNISEALVDNAINKIKNGEK